jgi:AcrR family transcriptional regulator
MVRKPNRGSNGAGSLARTSSRTGSPRKRRRDARRDEILRAAAKIFRERGFEAAGMRDIALAADLSPANLYHYFKGKDEILFYCQDRALDRMLAGVSASRRASPKAEVRLHAVAETHVLTMLDEVEGATAHLQVDALTPALRAQIVRKRDRYERAVRRLIAEGARAGTLIAPDAALAARTMLGALNWTATWYRPDGEQTPEQIASEMARLLVRGLKK